MKKTIELIKKYEGLSLKAYQDSAGIWTIGYGTTHYPNGEPVHEGDTCTEQEANYFLEMHLLEQVNLPNVKLSEDQKAALYSLIYNVGQTAFDNSRLKRAIINKDYKQIHHNWDWFSAGDKLLKGLVKRRCEELYLFMKDI